MDIASELFESEAARALGFDVDEPVYHGTTAGEFPTFKVRYRPAEQLGFGIHVTPDKNFAARYANDPDVARKGKKPYVFAGFLRKGKVLVADTLVREGTPEFELAKKLAGKRLMTSKDEDGVPCAYMQNAIDSTSPKRAEALIRAAGYDTIQYTARIGQHGLYGAAYSSPATKSYVVLNPAALRRQDATFDPAQIDSHDLGA